MSTLLSIVMPAYNGERSIFKTLDNLCSQVESGGFASKVEIVVTDDFSNDKTAQIVKELQTKYYFLHLFKNDKNLGMDRNFLQSMLNARGKYVWFFGQDDRAYGGAIKTVLRILVTDLNIQNIYVDYSQFDELRNTVVCSSMIERQAVRHLAKEMTIVEGSKEYFSIMNDGPSFLPATISRVDTQLISQLRPFMNTHYVQYANFLLGLNRGRTLILKKRLIQGLIPVNGWQKKGNSLLKISVGKLFCQHLMNQQNSSLFPAGLLQMKRQQFLRNYPKLLLLAFIHQLTDMELAQQQLTGIFQSPFSRSYLTIVNSFFLILIGVRETFFIPLHRFFQTFLKSSLRFKTK